MIVNAPPIRLELGGGRHPTSGYLNLDVVHGNGDFRRRAQDGIPLPDNSVEAARASHFLEHIPPGFDDRIAVMNEVHRVLKPGGVFEVIVPLYSPTGWGWGADPTHQSVWFEQSFWYFTGHPTISGAGDAIGIKRWDLVSWSVVKCEWGDEGHALLRKP